MSRREFGLTAGARQKVEGDRQASTGGVLTLVVRVRAGHLDLDLMEALNECLNAEDVFEMVDTRPQWSGRTGEGDTGWTYSWMGNPESSVSAQPARLKELAEDLVTTANALLGEDTT